MCSFELFFAIEQIGGCQCALLFFVKDHLDINIPPLSEIKINICPKEFFCKDRDIKFHGIVTCKITSLEKGGKFFGNFFKGGSCRNIFISNPMYGCCLRWDGYFRVYPGAHPLFFSVRANLKNRKFNNPIC